MGVDVPKKVIERFSRWYWTHWLRVETGRRWKYEISIGNRIRLPGNLIIKAAMKRCAHAAFLYGVRAGREYERAKAAAKIAALEKQLHDNYIDEIISETYMGAGDGLCDSSCITSRAIGLRKLAEWGIVEIISDHGRRVIARRLDMDDEYKPAPDKEDT